MSGSTSGSGWAMVGYTAIITLLNHIILKNLPRKGIVKLTNLINASFRLKYVPTCCKVAEVITISKPGKQANEVTSYRPISLLPVIPKLYENCY
jgi:hypothetical protein